MLQSLISSHSYPLTQSRVAISFHIQRISIFILISCLCPYSACCCYWWWPLKPDPMFGPEYKCLIYISLEIIDIISNVHFTKIFIVCVSLPNKQKQTFQSLSYLCCCMLLSGLYESLHDMCMNIIIFISICCVFLYSHIFHCSFSLPWVATHTFSVTWPRVKMWSCFYTPSDLPLHSSLPIS